MSESDIHNLTPDEVGEEFVATRLKEAREFLGLSQDAVASAMNLPRATISNIEGSKRKVTGVELQRFSKLYRRPIKFFLEHHVPEEDQVVAALFRATKDLTDGDRQQVLNFAEFLKHAGKPPKVED